MAMITRRPQRLLGALGALAAAVLTGGCLGGGGGLGYVALGDSYAAGLSIPVQAGTPAGCGRSDHNYPHRFALALSGASLQDVSCSGATTLDLTRPQSVSGGANPAQLDALNANTSVVTLTIGGNDIGFDDIVISCLAGTDNGTPCQDHFIVNGHDSLADRIAAVAPRVQNVLHDIRTRAPGATVYIVGYLDILPNSGTACFSQVPFTTGDVPYLRDTEKRLNATLQFVTVGSGDRYVDAYTHSIGHDACQPAAVRWVEPLSPVNAAPLHPNAAGMQAVADLLVAQ